MRNDAVLHADLTGININGKRPWLHTAMDDIGILSHFNGVMYHDHWKPYYRYRSLHSLCNAHHLCELTRSYEQDGQALAETMRLFLVSLNQSANNEDGLISKEKKSSYIAQYRIILKDGEKESPAPIVVKGKRGRPKEVSLETYLNVCKTMKVMYFDLWLIDKFLLPITKVKMIY